MRGPLRLAVGLALMAACAAPPAGAQAPAQDSVTGSGTVMILGGPVTGSFPFSFDVRSGPSGENPTGQVTIGSFFVNAPVTCLAVRTLPGPSPPAVTAATLGIQTAAGSIVTLQVLDSSPQGAPDTVAALLFSSRSPSDCSPISAPDAGGIVVAGDIVVIDAPAGPTTKGRCKNGGWRSFGTFRNQGRCVSS